MKTYQFQMRDEGSEDLLEKMAAASGVSVDEWAATAVRRRMHQWVEGGFQETPLQPIQPASS